MHLCCFAFSGFQSNKRLVFHVNKPVGQPAVPVLTVVQSASSSSKFFLLDEEMTHQRNVNKSYLQI